ncbi:MAG: PorV/PorQ family protein [Elusimicrobia bacterium]|nr:PorV/PorQ family protein [Elusimicrobiota bacterium]
MKRLAIALLFMGAAQAFAGLSSASRGTSAATFLTLGGGARGAAMAGAQTAAADGAFALQWNPAAIANAPGVDVELEHASWFESVDYNVAAAVVPTFQGQAAGVSVQQLNYGDLTKRDDSGYDQGNFTPKDLSAALAWGFHVGDYAWGVSGKVVRSEIVSSAQTAAADIGLLSPDKEGHHWGLAVSNVGGRLKYDSKSESLPLLVSAGASQRWKRFLFAGDLKFPRDNNAYVALGAEGSVGLGGAWEGVGRVGYSSRTQGGAGGLSGFSIGAGLRAGWFAFDYAFEPFDDLGSIQLFSLSLRGGGSRVNPD